MSIQVLKKGMEVWWIENNGRSNPAVVRHGIYEGDIESDYDIEPVHIINLREGKYLTIKEYLFNSLRNRCKSIENWASGRLFDKYNNKFNQNKDEQ
jgi:hypothetical protein